MDLEMDVGALVYILEVEFVLKKKKASMSSVFFPFFLI
jgi:hypothetical protein